MDDLEQEVIDRIAATLQRERLNQNLSQLQLADRAGISRRTLVQAETGHNTSLATLVKILNALGAIHLLEPLISSPAISPLELAKLRGKQRRRASGSRGNRATNKQSQSTTVNENNVNENKGDWTW